jgi:hypothetical protein
VRDNEVPTLRQFKIPVVLVIGGSEELLGEISNIAVSAQVLVSECGAQEATDTATQMLPLVLIMEEDVYKADSNNLEALARDVRAKIMRVGAGPHQAEILAAELQKLMAEAEEQRPSWTGELAGS